MKEMVEVRVVLSSLPVNVADVVRCVAEQSLSSCDVSGAFISDVDRPNGGGSIDTSDERLAGCGVHALSN